MAAAVAEAPLVPYPAPLVEARLVRRYKRFLCDVILPDGAEVVAHCPNPGSMRSCLEDDALCRLSPARPGRKLAWTLEQIRVGGTWIGVHTGRSNAVVEAAVAAGAVPELRGYPVLQREKRCDDRSRIDLLLLEGGELPPGADPVRKRGRTLQPATRAAWVEVKNVTLAEGRQARFPDSVSARGARHLEALIEVVARGQRGVLFFHVARGDVHEVAPADDIDPRYGATLRRAVEAGVEVLARRCLLAPEGLRLGEALPLVLP